MKNINDKIAKLLALAGNNPCEAEAKAALLRAHELMAKHKLCREDSVVDKQEKVIKSLIGISCSAHLCAWACNLSAIIAEHYCCVAFREHRKYKQIQYIGFIGLESDYKICTRIYRYAYHYVKDKTDEIFRTASDNIPDSVRRRVAEAYGWGFCRGLSDALKAQNDEHQEWGLVMVIPQEVKDASSDMKSGTYGKPKTDGSLERKASDRGYKDGKRFDPSRRLAEIRE